MTGLSTHTAKRKVEGKNVGRGMQASRHTHTFGNTEGGDPFLSCFLVLLLLLLIAHTAKSLACASHQHQWRQLPQQSVVRHRIHTDQLCSAVLK